MLFIYLSIFLKLLYLSEAVSPTNIGSQNNAVGQISEIGPQEVFRKTAGETSLTDLHNSAVQSAPENSNDEDSMNELARSFLTLLSNEKQVKTATPSPVAGRVWKALSRVQPEDPVGRKGTNSTLKITKRDVSNDLLYEVNEQGQQYLVKSINGNDQVLLRFTNLTNRRVNIWWRDYQGFRKHYALLSPNGSFDVTSYLTHPWEFIDADTNESYGINNNNVFLAPASIAGTQIRHNFDITKIY